MAGLVEHLEPALRRHGDRASVAGLVDRLADRGTGAEMQRASLARRGSLAGVVDDLVSLTART
jgi:carboxylate-amine ligase